MGNHVKWCVHVQRPGRFNDSLTHWPTQSLIHSFIHSFRHVLLPVSKHSRVHSSRPFFQPFIHWFSWYFICLFSCICWFCSKLRFWPAERWPVATFFDFEFELVEIGMLGVVGTFRPCFECRERKYQKCKSPLWLSFWQLAAEAFWLDWLAWSRSIILAIQRPGLKSQGIKGACGQDIRTGYGFFCAGRVSNISCDINSGCNMPFATQSCSLYLFCSDSVLNFVARLANNCFSCKQCGSICTAFKSSVKCASSCEVTAQASPIKAQQRWNLCVRSCDVKGDNLRTRSQISLGHT